MYQSRLSRNGSVLLLLVCAFGSGLLVSWNAAKLHSNERDPGDCTRSTFRSAHLILHTDLSSNAAHKLLGRVEATLDDSSNYWDRPVRGKIECFVVHDLKQWPDGALPHPMARVLVGRVGGAAIAERTGAGIQARNRAYVLASSRPGIAEHEIVHAYCGQTFGTTGPIWYREGMAQLLAFGPAKELGVNCPPEVIKQLKADQRRTIQQVMGGDAATTKLLNAFGRKVGRRSDVVGLIPVNDWNQADIQSLENIKRSYAWDWLLCHLLFQNPNYGSRFHSLGQGYLKRREDLFDKLFYPIMNELNFEYAFTLDRLECGYRIDLCHWDWQKRARRLDVGRTIRVSVASARGYQASGIELSTGCRYRYSADGRWQVDDNMPATDADGNDHGHGRLEAVVVKDYRLSEPFELGSEGQFRAPTSGHLYLRCRDRWNQLSDNDGKICVTFTR